jgi:hypothetical protein
MELHLHSPSTPLWRGAQLKKGTGTIYLIYIYAHIFGSKEEEVGKFGENYIMNNFTLCTAYKFC